MQTLFGKSGIEVEDILTGMISRLRESGEEAPLVVRGEWNPDDIVRAFHNLVALHASGNWEGVRWCEIWRNEYLRVCFLDDSFVILGALGLRENIETLMGVWRAQYDKK